MTRITGSGLLVSALSRQLGVNRRKTDEGRGASGGAQAAPPAASTLQETVASRIKAIDPDDPQRARRALRVFLEAVIVDEFGAHLLEDPAFFQMIDTVQTAMEGDPRLTQAIAEAMRPLLAA